jgi:UDP-N-acetylglucosamine 3-dehydrogenase
MIVLTVMSIRFCRGSRPRDGPPIGVTEPRVYLRNRGVAFRVARRIGGREVAGFWEVWEFWAVGLFRAADRHFLGVDRFTTLWGMTRIGIIGAGPNAQGHGRYYTEAAGRSKVVAVADVDEARARAMADACNAKAVTDFRSFLPDVDAVVVASPNFLHKEQAIACAKAGKHVYCEKPMGLSLSDAIAIDSAIRAAGVRSQVGFSVRFDPTIQTMIRMSRAGVFGNLISLASRRLMWMDPAKSTGWRKDPALSGGLLFEINIHELEWMCYLGGPVQSVFARVYKHNPHPRASDHLFVTLGFASGAGGMHEGSWIASTPQFWRQTMGDAGGAYTNEWGNLLYTARNGENRIEAKLDPAFDIRGDFLAAIETGAETTASASYAVRIMAVAEAVLQSAATGEAVRPEVQ